MIHCRMIDGGFFLCVQVLFDSTIYLSINMCSDHWFVIYLATSVSFFVQCDRTMYDEYERVWKVHCLFYSNIQTYTQRDYEYLNYHSQPLGQYLKLELTSYDAEVLSIT